MSYGEKIIIAILVSCGIGILAGNKTGYEQGQKDALRGIQHYHVNAETNVIHKYEYNTK